MNGDKLDEIDLRILNVLQAGARLSFARIAELVGLTHTPVQDRIHKMEQAGIINSYFAMLDREKTGRPVLVILSLKISPQNQDTLLQFEEAMSKLPEVQQVWVVSGDWNFILHVTARSPQDYFIFLMEKISSLPFVGQTESAVVLRDSKSYTPYLFEAK